MVLAGPRLKVGLVTNHVAIGDLVNNISLVKNYYLKKNKKTASRVFNLGNPKTISLKKLIKTMENISGKKFKKKYIKKQPGDVIKTIANLNIEKNKFKLKFSYDLKSGMEIFYSWFKKYKNI